MGEKVQTEIRERAEHKLCVPAVIPAVRQAAKACGMPCGTFYSKALRIEEKNRPTFGTDS